MQGAAPTSERPIDETAIIGRVTLRLVPFLMACYFVSFLDRVNLGFAALQMNHDLHLSPTVFGLGGGIFPPAPDRCGHCPRPARDSAAYA